MIRTLAERKRIEGDRRRLALQALMARLQTYARSRGGRFVLYGSLARGAGRQDSDADLIVDFPEDRQADAWRFAERASRDAGFEPDICARSFCSPEFLNRIDSTARVLA